MDIYEKLREYTAYSLGKSDSKCELLYQDETLEAIDFTPFDLNNSNFLEVSFRHCNFSGVYMSGASFCGSEFKDCTFFNNRFRKGKASYAVFKETNLIGLDAFRTEFYETSFCSLTISGAEMVRCWMGSARFDEVNIEHTDLRETHFLNASFHNVLLKHCILGDNRFESMDGITFDDVCIEAGGKLLTGLGDAQAKTMLERAAGPL